MNTKALIYSLRIVWCIAIMLPAKLIVAQDENDVNTYIERYKNLAIAEQTRSGVPASITLAQGIHESSAGKSELATKGNNHFGIKCKSTWTGETILHDDDKKQECFRKYISAEQSYIDHSDFLRGSNRYHFLFDLELTDYAGWASGLKRAGYATNPMYVKRLTDLVEKYNLQQYTYEGISKSPIPKGEVVPEKDEVKSLTHVDDPSTYYKGLTGFWAKKGESLLPKAMEKNIRYAKLLSMNDLADEPLEQDMFVFTEKKRKIGTEEFHTVKEGENMHMISQKEAIMLNMLYSYNNMIPGQEPVVGERLCLLYKIYGKPKLKQQFLAEIATNTPKETIVAKLPETKKEEPIAMAPIEKTETPTEESKEEIPLAIETKQELQEEVKLQVKEIPVEKIETVAETIPHLETKQPEVALEVQKTEIVETTSNTNILDEDKAKRIEALLNTNRLDGTTAPNIEPKKEVNKEADLVILPIVTKVEQVPITKVEEPKVEIEIPKPTPIPKRNYDEVGIDDSVKTLKKKFDQIVYRPRPSRKVEPAVQPNKETSSLNNKVNEEPKKVTEKKQLVQKVEQTKQTDKTTGIEKTKTGIKRDLNKTAKPSVKEEKKKVDPKKLTAKEKAALEKEKKSAEKEKKTNPKGKKSSTKNEKEIKNEKPEKKTSKASKEKAEQDKKKKTSDAKKSTKETKKKK